jgi:hypothetical protein
MRKQPLPLNNPFRLTFIGLGIWVTNLIIAREVVQAIREQNALMARAMYDHPPVWPLRIDPAEWPPDGAEPDRMGVGAAPAMNPVLVFGESGDDEAILATPLDGVPLDDDRGPISDFRDGGPGLGFVFQRNAS